MRHELDAREYKLLLNPKRFLEASPHPVADNFWDEQLKPLIRRLGSRNGGEPRHAGRFEKSTERIVRFWDTPDCDLTRADLALRERLSVEDDASPGARPKITLKLRMPDLFVVAAADLPGSGGKFSTTFEEDIAPLEIDDPKLSERSVVLPAKRSIRSRFARSTTQKVEWPTSSLTLADIRLMFPTILDFIAGSGVRPATETALISGPTIRELVFEGASVRLNTDIVGVFALTLWFFGPDRVAPTVAEISFKCATVGGDMPGKAARRALDLFIGMQELGGWVNTEHSSKTLLALPKGCGTPLE
ncbi:hypothetical protein GOB91_09525 [Sinorhizobium meliloti]|nr:MULTISPECIES: hypothetical protein [Sinorhizobium]MDW9722558.1 hypothetical protein [Sinorhizobium meliloti]MDW9730774.1 hypothetical protein [Sinorhizobium meliloti]MDW9784898.1 hypothetical protein [Sinorhizobium meliloti]MDX0654373.1 hypothetical protein [Sinorhizobium medicae]MDX0980162.1 hypothetical protein [Sinorhizobium medicae]